jgi:hypothetical protein
MTRCCVSTGFRMSGGKHPNIRCRISAPLPLEGDNVLCQAKFSLERVRAGKVGELGEGRAQGAGTGLRSLADGSTALAAGAA